MEKELFAKIDSYLDYALALQAGLTAIPALDPTCGGQGEFDKAQWIETELRKLKFDKIFRVDAPQKEAKNGVRPNIIARYNGIDSSKTLWIMTHLDVVPPGEMASWKTNPFKMERMGNKIYGRGVEDNQQGMVASIIMLRAFMELGLRPPCDVALLLNADEETGSVYGADYVLKQRPDLFGKNDSFIVPDGGRPDGSLAEVAEKSILWLKIHTQGKQVHASMPQIGKNAFKAGAEMAVKLGSLYKTFKAKDKLFVPPFSTFEPTKKDANVPNINTIPGDDVFYLDCRVLPQYHLSEVHSAIAKIAREVEDKHGVTIEITPIQESQAAPATSSEATVVRAVVDGVKAVYGTTAKAGGIGGGTVAACFRRHNLPAIVYSKLDEAAHMPNEYCIIDNMMGDAKVFAFAALRMK